MRDQPERPRVGRRSSARYILTRGAPYLLIPALAYFVWARRDEVSTSFEAPLALLLAIVALIVVTQWLNAAEFYVQYRAAGIDLRLHENWGLFNAGQLGNYLPAQAGTIYRFRYLKVVHGAAYSTSASTMAMNLVITMASTAVCGFAGVLGTAAIDGRAPSWVMLAVLAALGLAAVGFTSAPLPPRIGRPGGRLHRVWLAFHRSWSAASGNPRVAVGVFLIELVKLTILMVRFYLVFDFVGLDAPITVYLVLGPIAALTAVVAITPGGLGLREGAVAGSAAAMGYAFPAGLLGATIDRGLMIFTTVVLGAVGYAITWPRMRRRTASPDALSLRGSG